MSHIRIFRHYFHTPYLIMAAVEALLLFFAAFLGYYTRQESLPNLAEYWVPASAFAVLVSFSMLAMGVFESRVREGYLAMMLRTAVAIFLLGTIAVALATYLVPAFTMGRGVLLFSTLEGFLLIGLFRLTSQWIIKEDSIKRRVMVIGTGQRAKRIAEKMRRRSDQRAFKLVGFVQIDADTDLVSQYGVRVLCPDETLREIANQYDLHEFVIALDERRRNQSPRSPGLPLDELLECRLSGLEISDVEAFIEREACKVDVDLLHPSWMVFSDGFVFSFWRDLSKRVFDLLASTLLLLVTWPVIVTVAFLIGVSSRFRHPVLYRQVRVGLDNKPFEVLKFRSMKVDAETTGAVWATPNDPRVTRIGEFIRNTRIDELPQLFNVFRGDMSFVGPRPERPVFVDEFNESIPYYAQRHRVKPGITGWAQLCYPYGASLEDAKEKLQYDLYYLKNRSLLLDIIILLQTVEVVLVGDGAR